MTGLAMDSRRICGSPGEEEGGNSVPPTTLPKLARNPTPHGFDLGFELRAAQIGVIAMPWDTGIVGVFAAYRLTLAGSGRFALSCASSPLARHRQGGRLRRCSVSDALCSILQLYALPLVAAPAPHKPMLSTELAHDVRWDVLRSAHRHTSRLPPPPHLQVLRLDMGAGEARRWPESQARCLSPRPPHREL